MEYFNLPVDCFIVSDNVAIEDGFKFTTFEKADEQLNKLRDLYPSATYILYARIDA